MSKLFSLKRPAAQIQRFRKENVHKSTQMAFLVVRKTHTYNATLIVMFLNNDSQKDCPLLDTEKLPQIYNSRKVVEGRCQWWKEKGLFAPSGNNDCKTFSLLLPPPNVTGTLHLGHALTATIQDVLVKWHRMCGDDVLWIPGTDHAGIATQVMVDKYLQSCHISRDDLGRNAFIKEVLKWQKRHSGAIDLALKDLGCSLHWSKYYFTMDEDRSFAVQEAFIQLFNSGLIYRKKSLVNWCCHLQSSISDIEVEKISLEGKTALSVPGYPKSVEFGILFKFAYKLCDKDEEVVVATTRPETMFADLAVAVHPSDERYSHLRGSYLWHPYREEKIPIIFDESVDPGFGTGAVKITPGHNFVDYEIGERHNLGLLTCISEKGNLVNICGIFNGQKRFEGRKLLLDDLSERDLLRGHQSHAVELPVCSRSGDVLEFLLKPQWYIKMERLSKEALEAVESGELELEPSRYKDDWRRWMSNCRDWNISRQLWWGHRIPVFRLKSDNTDSAKWVAAGNKEEAKLLLRNENVCDDDDLHQDEDVLDTWFSSSILPFSSLGWPKKTDELQRYYPLSMMITGHDILFFWVARMVMLGKELTGVLPFKKVLLHSLMCDSRGKKMSKSLGNVITPENVSWGISLERLQKQVDAAIESLAVSNADGMEAKKIQMQDFPKGIPPCGVDALRMSLCSKDIRNSFMSFHLPMYTTNLFFCNKIWQAYNFHRRSLEKDFEPSKRPRLEKLNLGVIDHWILSCLANVVTKLDSDFKETRIDSCFNALQNFLRTQLCDIYIESCKPRFAAGGDEKLAALVTLSTCLETFLILMTPFAPYLTEALYSLSPWKSETHDSILSVPYPKAEEWKSWLNPSLEEEVKVIVNIVRSIREIKQRNGVKAKDQCNVVVETVSRTLEEYVPQMNELIRTLTSCEISKVILRSELKVDKLSASDALIGNDVLVRVRISDAPTQRVGPVGKENVASIRKREQELLKNLEEMEARSGTGMKREEVLYEEERHINVIAAPAEGAHERQVKVDSLMRRKLKLLKNVEELKDRIEIQTTQGKTFNEKHHVSVKLAQWIKLIEEINIELNSMIEDLKRRKEPIPTIKLQQKKKKQTGKTNPEKQVRSTAPS